MLNEGKATVLVADDTPANQVILNKGLSKNGYEVIIAKTGQEAVDVAQSRDDIELFLLDVMMPEMDGFEAATHIKKIAGYSDTPVVFITAKTEQADKSRGFEIGGVDYIPKPFYMAEVLNRLSLHIEIARNRKALHAYGEEMETLAKERAKQLAHADRLATLGTLSAGIAHEVNNPTTFISGNAQTLKRLMPVLDKAIAHYLESAPPEATQLQFFREEAPKILDGMLTGVSRIKKIVDSLKTFAHRKDGQQEPYAINNCVSQALVLTHNALKNTVTVDNQVTEGLPSLMGDAQQIEQVLINLFVNASHAMEGRSDATLTIKASHVNEKIVLTIEDNGPGIPADKLERIWDPFFTTKPIGKGTGLGLSLCQNMIEAHGGQISVHNKDAGGACFTIELPVQSAAAPVMASKGSS